MSLYSPGTYRALNNSRFHDSQPLADSSSQVSLNLDFLDVSGFSVGFFGFFFFFGLAIISVRLGGIQKKKGRNGYQSQTVPVSRLVPGMAGP